MLVDDPLLTAREIPRARPLIRVVFDRRLRVPASARLFSTLEAGPVIIVTTPDSLSRNPAHARELERVGAHVEPITRTDLLSALRRLAEKQIVSLVLEGGPTLHRAAASEGVVDAVHLYVAPDPVGDRGVPWLDAGELRLAALDDRRVHAIAYPYSG